MFLKNFGLVANLTMFVPIGLIGYASYNFYLMGENSYSTKDKKYVKRLIDNEVYKEKVLNKRRRKPKIDRNKTILIRKSNPDLEPDF